MMNKVECNKLWGQLRVCVVAGLIALNAPLAVSATGSYIASVTKIMIDDSNYGGCMVFTNPGPQTIVPACKNGWVTLDCLAEFPGSTKSKANSKLAAAQLAYATGNNLGIDIDSSYSVNGGSGTGYCLATKVTNR